MIHAPEPSVTVDRSTRVSVWVAVTVTPGSTAPLSSVTRPASSAVAWAQARLLVSNRLNAATEKMRRQRLITQSSTQLKRSTFSSEIGRMLHPNAKEIEDVPSSSVGGL